MGSDRDHRVGSPADDRRLQPPELRTRLSYSERWTPFRQRAIARCGPDRPDEIEQQPHRGGDKEAVIGEQVTLDGSGSHDPDPDGEIISYKWEQKDGPTVSLQGANQPFASFSVPKVEEDTTFEFTLAVTDNEGAESEDGVEVQVDAPTTTTDSR